MSDHYTDADLETAAAVRYSPIPEEFDILKEVDPEAAERVRGATRRILDAAAPAISSRAAARAWDEGFEAAHDWIGNNPPPSGIWSDPPRNPYADEREVQR